MRAATLFLAAALASVVTTFACKSADSARLRSEDGVEAGGANAGEGEFCGGFGGIKCADGLKCKQSGGGLGDAGGKCVKNPNAVAGGAGGPAAEDGPGAKKGEFCGGFGAIKCNTGLKCKQSGGGLGDSGGKCVDDPNAGSTAGSTSPPPTSGSTWGEEGGSCGGFAGFTCKTGLACVGAGPADKPGKCVQKTGGSTGGGSTAPATPAGPTWGEENGSCGGFAGFACKSGLKCVGSGPADKPGKCLKATGGATAGGGATNGGADKWGVEGGSCGGFAGISCKAGLQCKGAGPADKPGKCVKKVAGFAASAADEGVVEGGACGGFAGIACKSGLTCAGQGLADQPGSCQKLANQPQYGEEGGFCGGFVGFPCNAGLLCRGSGPADQPGRCEKNNGQPNWGERGGPCGGFVGFTCGEGSQCVGAGAGDEPGTCQAAGTQPEWGASGGACGGLANIQCANGAECQGQGGADQPGTCP